jgi:hypothetical protein
MNVARRLASAAFDLKLGVSAADGLIDGGAWIDTAAVCGQGMPLVTILGDGRVYTPTEFART